MPNNVISSNLLCGKLIESIGYLQGCLAPLSAFSTVIPVDGPAKLPLEVSLCTEAPATQTDPTDFSPGTSVYDDRAATPVHYSQTFGVSIAESESGVLLDVLMRANLDRLAATLSDAVMALITEADYGSPVVSVSSANWNSSDFDALFGGIASPRRGVVLSTEYFCKVKGPWLPVGFTNVREQSRWGTAGTGLKGFVCDPRAVLALNPMPEVLPTPDLVQKPFTVEPGLRGMACAWFDEATRGTYASFDVVLGVTAGDKSALKLLKTT
jgi:hypothetical protein